MKIAVIGSRNYKNINLLDEVLYGFISREDVIITGGAEGVDKHVMDFAKKEGIELEVFYPDWDKYGKAAGPIRNELIIKDSDLVLAFWDGESKGTKNSIDLALKYKVGLRVYFNV